jgi:Tannase and feruloyl esterase
MTQRLLVGAVCAICAVGAAAVSAQQNGHAQCAHLTMLKLPDVKVTEAVEVPTATSGAIRAAHCKVTGVIGTEIRFALLLPENWNRKFVMGGGGGYVGSIDNQAQRVVNDGYATAGTDTGHQGGVTDASWALNNPERLLNFGYLAVHRTAEVAKAIVRSYYGATEARSYFSGCSNGGRQALMEAQRYPDDFDGIIAGAPAYDFVGIAAQFLKDIQAAFPDSKNPAPMFTPETLKSVEAQILDKCDALDGAKDGLMEDPRRCNVDPASLTGLTDIQKAVLKKIYAETAAKGQSIYPAQPVGGEGQGPGWAPWIVGSQPAPTPQGPSLRFAFGTQFFKYFVFNDPAWDYTRYEVANVRADAKFAGLMLNATSPDLDAFKAKGRKLVVWHGWADPALTPLATIRYHEQVQTRDPAARDYFRTFLMPGVLHCTGGPGPDTVDWTAVIADWVENAKAPDRIVARKIVNGAVTRTHPLCPYPQKAEYKGSGGLDDEGSFVCK